MVPLESYSGLSLSPGAWKPIAVSVWGFRASVGDATSTGTQEWKGEGDLHFEQVQSLAQLSSLPPAWLVVKVQGFALNRGRAWGHWGTGQVCDLKSLPLLVERRSPHRQPLQGFQFTPPSVGPSVISRSEQVLYQCYLLLSNIPALIEDSLTDFPSDSLWEPSGEIKIPGSHHRLLNQLLQGWALSQHEEQNLTPFFGWWKLTSLRQGLFRELNESKYNTFPEKCTYPQHCGYNFRGPWTRSPAPEARSDSHSPQVRSPHSIVLTRTQAPEHLTNSPVGWSLCPLWDALPDLTKFPFTGAHGQDSSLISGPGLAVLPLWRCFDFCLMKIVSHFATCVLLCAEFLIISSWNLV